MFVCVDDNGPRLVGWTTLEPPFMVRHRYAHDPGTITALRMAEPAPIPPPGEAFSAEITRHEFATRTVFRTGEHRGIGLSAIILRPEDDPTVLPGWEPREEAVERVCQRRGNGPIVPMVRVTPAEFARIPRGLPPRPRQPVIWTLRPVRGVETLAVWPKPGPGYELVIERGRTFSFEPPASRFAPGYPRIERRWATVFGVDPALDPDVRPVRFDRMSILRSNGDRHDNRVENLRVAPIPFAITDTILFDRALDATERGALQEEFLRRQHERLAEAMIAGQFGLGGTLNAAPAPQASTAAQLRQQIAQFVPRIGDGRGLSGGNVVWDNPPPPGGYDYHRGLTAAAVRDLLMPGLMGMYGLSPRIDPETAAQSRARARGLLKSLLRPEQWAEFEAHGYVCERIGARFFTLKPGGMIEVQQGPPHPHLLTERWCIAPDVTQEWLPPEDQLIGQLLHLRAGPAKLRKKANVFHG